MDRKYIEFSVDPMEYQMRLRMDLPNNTPKAAMKFIDEITRHRDFLLKQNEEIKKENKKLSQKDKEVLEEILHNIEHHGTDEYHNDGGGWFYEAKVNLLKRLLK